MPNVCRTATIGGMSSEQLTALDATFLELEEADQSAHMHIGGVMLLEPPPGGAAPDLETVRAGLEARLDSLPRYRQRLSEPRTGGLQWPSWIDDERFEIAHHVRAAALPEPAGEAELLAWAGEYFSTRLDRARPLWELVLISLADGRWALVSKTHHCMVDGVGSIDIAHTLFDTEPEFEPTEPRVRRVAVPPNAPEQSSLVGQMTALPRTVGTAGVDLARGAVHAAGAAARAAIHPATAISNGRALAEVLIRDEVQAAPATSLNAPIGAARTLAVIKVDLDQVKAIKRTLGGTVNDVVLAATAGGLRRLLVERGETPPRGGLRAMVPVNIRAAAEHLELGNKISSLFVHLPVDEPDPRRRYACQLAEAERLKAGDQALGSREIIDLAAHAPPVLHTFLARSLFATRLFNVTVTNVPGPQMPLYAYGSRMVAVWPLVPLAAEHALGVAVLSYDGRIFFCLNAASDSVPDLDRVADGIADALAELATLSSGEGSAVRATSRAR
jgi:diacylglycerol O-acyltransferase / wax synthase